MATLQLLLLAQPVSAGYRAMVRPEHLPHLAAAGEQSGEWAIGVQMGGEPLGLALAKSAGTSTEVLSLFVTEAWRRRGLGTHLLTALEEQIALQGVRLLHLQYSTEMPAAPALERVLAKCGWCAPERTMILTQITTAMFAQTPWMQQWQVPPEFCVFPWSELSSEERASLERIRHEVPPALLPFDQGAPLEPSGSLGLRHSGEVVGWVVLHRVAPDIVRYTALYVRPPWQRAALTFSLLAEAIRRQVAACGPQVRGAMAVLEENRPMIRVLERHFRPYASHWFEARTARKQLG